MNVEGCRGLMAVDVVEDCRRFVTCFWLQLIVKECKRLDGSRAGQDGS